MKTIQLNDLKKDALLTQKEPIAIEYNNKIVGYYNPVINFQEAKKAKEELDNIMEKVLEKTGVTEEEYLSMFMKTEE
ncbi:hypothetical protein [Crocosphaera sp.]|uniref:hypothetical protein n=1 Tax=Crocosphaera sp. TaxID=2729996 RepID=UPI00262AC3FD|nr:hypothetical protein [Crocosphaera sp.]MDJ0580701.1 hypothetical protein [Crocosphaera sp.]